MQLAPNFCLGLLAFSEAGKAELNELLSWWSSRSNNNYVPNFIELDLQQEPAKIQAEFWQKMYVQKEQQIYSLAQRISTLQKQYLELRTLHENMQNAFVAVEDYLSQAKLPPLQLAFENQPTQKLVEPSTISQSNSVRIKQLLPVSSRGIAVIELLIVRKNKNAVGNLIVQLKACEDETCFAQWQIPYEQLSDGWLSLDLPRIDIGRKRDVELIIDWNTQTGFAPALVLGAIQLIPELRAYCNERPLKHSLAFRIWQGLPGTRKVTSPHLKPVNQDREIKLGYLGQGVMAGVQEVTNQPDDSFAHVQVIDRGSKIMTHPRVNGDSTIAILPFSFSSKANYLTATVITEHEEADTMEYAMAVISKDTKLENDLPAESTLAYSGWIPVESNTQKRISVFLDSPPPENCHIVIAAKLAPDSKPDCAWCRWLNFRLDYHLQNPEENEQLKTETIRNASLDSLQERFPRVQILNAKGKIQVHPFMGIDTVAVLPRAVPQNTVKVKTVVCTPNEKASAIEYAMAIIEQDNDDLARLAVISGESGLGFSGWRRVKANTPHRLNLELAYPTKKTCHLVLATRIPEDGSQNHAWARWLEINYVSAVANQSLELVG
ncbi:DUF6212 domain-containing protein [Pleurocapsa sp. PCC 7319]|uniref:DUF6212 domain-containing protein n=1 Tax=Pleurocapsa sp. PCC 7319 TaxID=118161 RepID=UPI00034A139A|nr:DUF6212 domain-containing protein [Pleurocapsa sp. PCC 7319]